MIRGTESGGFMKPNPIAPQTAPARPSTEGSKHKPIPASTMRALRRGEWTPAQFDVDVS